MPEYVFNALNSRHAGVGRDVDSDIAGLGGRAAVRLRHNRGPGQATRSWSLRMGNERMRTWRA